MDIPKPQVSHSSTPFCREGCVTVLGILGKDRLLTGCPLGRAQIRARLFAVTYRAATVRERSPGTVSPKIGYAPCREDFPERRRPWCSGQ